MKTLRAIILTAIMTWLFLFALIISTLVVTIIERMVYADTLKVAIIDTGLDLKDTRFKKHLCKMGHRDFTGEGITDYHGHGTHIAGLIQEYAGKGNYCFVILKYYIDSRDSMANAIDEGRAFQYAAALGVDIVNFSGDGDAPLAAEQNAIADNPGILFVVAAGNSGRDLDALGAQRSYPACYPYSNIVAVGSLDPDFQRSWFSNYGNKVTAWEVGNGVSSTLPGGRRGQLSGTSQATAIRCGRLVRARLKRNR